MVTTRGGTETGSSIIVSSPATLKSQKKRAAESTDGEQDSPSLSKRKKVDKTGNTRGSSPVISKKIAVRLHPDAEIPATSAEEQTGEQTPTLPARNHVRFNSASPPPAIKNPAIAKPQVVAEQEAEESDDDAAPEEVSLSTAKAQSRAVEEQTEQVIKELGESAKRRRRRRDAQLKAQVAGSTKRIGSKAKTVLKVVEEGETTDAEHSAQKEKKKSKNKNSKTKRKHKEAQEPTTTLLDNIPDLLPDELLATEAPVRLPTPPPSSNAGLSKDTKTFEPFAAMKIPRESAPKDLIYNDLSVRVLGRKNALLPPKVTSRSKSIRDTWLKGRSAFAKPSSKRVTGGKLQRRPMASATKAFV